MAKIVLLVSLLFLLDINNISTNIQSAIRLFANDGVVYGTMTPSFDNIILQAVLDKITRRCDEWQMHINTNKAKHMTFTTKGNVPEHFYKINSIEIEKVESVKYLGVPLTSSLPWKLYIAECWL